MVGGLFLDGQETCRATFDEERRYRYTLERWWHFDGFLCVWVMLNPSTADEQRDDPTIRKCIGFTKRMGGGGIAVVNLFGLRSTDPAALYTTQNPVGDQNDDAIVQAFGRSSVVVAGWGKHGAHPKLKYRAQQVEALATRAGRTLMTLGTNGDGSPKHPLFVPYETKLVALRATPVLKDEGE